MWKFNGKDINSIEDMGENIPHGFIYIVTHIPSGKRYIGKKVIYHNSKKKLGKKELLNAPKTQGRPAKFKMTTKESDWSSYYGSNITIKNMIKEGKKDEFTREIIQFVYCKKMLSYFETKLQFINEVLEYPDLWFNDNIQGSFFTTDFNK